MHIKPKKSLGQNFLVDPNIRRKIISACRFSPSDIVLEIGAGRGELSRLIAEKVGALYTLEVDSVLCRNLKDNLCGYSNIKIIHRDILKFDLRDYFKKAKKEFPRRLKVFGNIPYYITTPIIEHLIKFRNEIDTIFITVQKEFAQRIAADAGLKEYGSFSCFVQYYAEPEKLFFIKKNSFFPIPKVDSCFLKLKIRQEPPVKIKDEKLFFQIIRAAFNQRRKILRNSLRDTVSPEKLERFFQQYAINPQIRPEELSLQDFANLANI